MRLFRRTQARGCTRALCPQDDDRLHQLAQTEIILLLLAGNVFYWSPLNSFDDATDWGLSLTLIGICVLFLAVFLYVALVVARRYYNRWKNATSADDSKVQDEQAKRRQRSLIHMEKRGAVEGVASSADLEVRRARARACMRLSFVLR